MELLFTVLALQFRAAKRLEGGLKVLLEQEDQQQEEQLGSVGG